MRGHEMNILLVNPPIPNKFRMLEYADDEASKIILKRVLVGPPIGLNELAGVAKDENVIIIDQKAELESNPDYNFIEAIEMEIHTHKPDIIGITCLTAQYNSVIKLLKAIKKIDKNILVTIGGLHATLCPQDFVGTEVDIVSIGIGKYSFYNIVKEYKKNRKNPDFSKICGIVINKGGEFHYNKPLSEIPYKELKDNYLFDHIQPNRRLTDKYNYWFPGLNRKIDYISTSQGCTHKCNFCSIWPTTCGHYFHKEIEYIFRDLKEIREPRVVRFCDANTFGDITKIEKVFQRIIEEGYTHHYYVADIRAETAAKHPNLIKLAAKAGLKAVICGLEATNDEELKKYKKSTSRQIMQEGLKVLNEEGIMVNGNYIVRPDYEERNFEGLAQFVQENPIYNSGFTILTPFPGTQQWEELKHKVVIKDYDYYNLTNAVLETALDEREFYNQVGQLYKVSGVATKEYLKLYDKDQRITKLFQGGTK